MVLFFISKLSSTKLSYIILKSNLLHKNTRLSKLNAGCVNLRVQHLCLNSSRTILVVSDVSIFKNPWDFYYTPPL